MIIKLAIKGYVMGSSKAKSEDASVMASDNTKKQLLAEAEAKMKAYYYLLMSPAKSDDELLAKAAIALGDKLFSEALEIKERVANL